MSKEYREFCKTRNIGIEYCTPRLHPGNGANIHIVTGSNWITRKGTPLPLTTHKPAEFMPEEITPPGTSSFN